MKQLTYREIEERFRNIPESLQGQPLPFRFLLDGVQSLANVGAIFRIADAIKADHVHFIHTPPFDPNKLKRYSRKCHEYVPNSQLSLEELRQMKADWQIVACEFTDSSVTLGSFSWQFPTLLVLGSERTGISQDVLDHCIAAVHLPMLGRNSSINVATAGGIVGYRALEEWVASSE